MNKIYRLSLPLFVALSFVGVFILALQSRQAWAAASGAAPAGPDAPEANRVITVTTNLDNDVADAFCSFREAIKASNANANYNGCMRQGSGTNKITFDLGPGTQTITLTQVLPNVTVQVIVDGADDDSARTEITGGGLNLSASLFTVYAVGSEFHNLVVNNFTGAGTLFSIYASNVAIENSWIGLSSSGDAARPMPQTLFYVISGSNGFRLGGPNAAQGNRISGVFSGAGYMVNAYENGSGLVQNNYIGLNANGSAVTASNLVSAIELSKSSGWQIKNNVIGGIRDTAINILNLYQAGNGGHVIQGNIIGALADGNTCAPVGGGIALGGSTSNLIGGSNPGEGNIIGCTTQTYPGAGYAIIISDMNNNGPFFIANNVVRGNSIGVGADGVTPLPIYQGGISINTDSFPAYLTTVEGNTIANVGAFTGGVYPGIEVVGNARITGNRIFNTEKIAIDLNGASYNAFGVTRNDALDADSGGGNDGQNYPHLTRYMPVGSGALVQGVLHSEPNQTYRIELFSSDHLNASFFGEAQTFLGALDVTTDANGNAQISFNLAAQPAYGSYLAATATDPNGYTSELSMAFPVANPQNSGLLAFQSNRDGDADIYTMKADGSNLTNVTNWHDTPSLRNDYRPHWAWNGSRLLFDAYGDGGTGQNNWMLDLSSSKGWEFVVCNEIWGLGCYDQDYFATLSPDNRTLAVVSEEYYGPSRRLYLFDFAKGTQTSVFSVPKAQDVGGPAWSADGSKLAFHSNKDGDYDLYVLDIATQQALTLTLNTTNDTDPAWSPDGSQIAFTTNRDGNYEVYIMNADGSNAHNVSSFPGASDYHPSFAPDGSLLAFVSERDGNPEIYLMNADGSAQSRLTNNPANDWYPVWQSAPEIPIAISDAAAAEGSPLEFAVSLAYTYTSNISMHYTTVNGSALAGSDYTAASGTLVIPAGDLTATLTVNTLTDALYELNETFTVQLSNPSLGVLLDSSAQGVIQNNDALPQISVNDASIQEGDSLTQILTFSVSLSAPSTLAISVNYATQNGTAAAGSDYLAASGTVNIPAGATSAAISVTVNGDTTLEPSESFTLSLSSPVNATLGDAAAQGLIVNDEPIPLASLAGNVWFDYDASGRREDGEYPLANVQVTVQGQNAIGGSVFSTTLTDANGGWLLNPLPIGTYTVSASKPGYTYTVPAPLNLILPEQGVNQADIGLIDNVPANKIRFVGRLWSDLNGNGVKDAGEPAIFGPSVQLYRNNAFVTAGLVNTFGLFRFEVNGPAGEFELRTTAGLYLPNPARVQVSGQLGRTSRALFGLTLAGKVDGQVGRPRSCNTCWDWMGLSGITVQLEQPAGVVISTTQTGSNGIYNFGLLPLGEYLVRILPPANLLPVDGQTTQAVRLDQLSRFGRRIWYLAAQQEVRIAAQQSAPSFGVSGLVSQPLAGVRFRLQGLTYGQVYTVTSGLDGWATAVGMVGGQTYRITTVLSSLPPGSVVQPAERGVSLSSNPAQAFTTTQLFTLSFPNAVLASCRSTIDASFTFDCTARITVLSNTAGTAPGTVVFQRPLTQSQPEVLATGLITGSYQVELIPYAALPSQANWPVAVRLVSVNRNSASPVVGYPYLPSRTNTTISGFAFLDRNRDGQWQDTGLDAPLDPGAAGLVMELRNALNGSLVMTTTTTLTPDGRPGYYEFTNLGIGMYFVQLVLPANSISTDKLPPYQQVSTVTLLNSIPQRRLAYAYMGELSGRMFYDRDEDGLFSQWDDPVTQPIQVFQGNSLFVTLLPAPDGSYRKVLPAGVYRLVVPFGIADYGVIGDVNRMVSITPAGAVVDFTYFANKPAKRALIFVDANLNGRPEPEEQRLSGIRLGLNYPLCGITPTSAQAAVSDSSGMVEFPIGTQLNDGCFVLSQGSSLPPGMAAAYPQGVSTPRGNSRLAWIPVQPAGQLTLRFYWDVDGDQIQDADEPSMPGIGAHLTNDVGFDLEKITDVNGEVNLNLPATVYDLELSLSGYDLTTTLPLPYSFSVLSSAANRVPVPLHYARGLQISVRSQNQVFPGIELTVCTPACTTTFTDAYGRRLFFLSSNSSYSVRINMPAGYTGPTILSGHYNNSLQVVTFDLVALGDVTGNVYWDANSNGVQDAGEGAYDPGNVRLIVQGTGGFSTLSAPVSPAGTFLFRDLQPGVLHSFVFGLPSSQMVTQSPGWFTVGSQDEVKKIGIGPANTTSGSASGAVVRLDSSGAIVERYPGLVVGYYRCSDTTKTILGQVITDASGSYRLYFPPGDRDRFCLKLLTLPSSNLYTFQQAAPHPEVSSYITTKGTPPTHTPRHTTVNVRLIRKLTVLARDSAAGNMLSLSAFLDANTNGVWDAGEQPLAGVLFTSGAASATTGLNGQAQLSGLNDGMHQLDVTAPTGYALVGAASQQWVFTNGVDLIQPALGFRQSGALSGTVFADQDGDGWQGLGETGLGGITLTVSGPAISYTLTAPNGSYAFFGLPAGNYTLAVDAGNGFLPAATQPVTETGLANFGLHPATGLLAGSIYDDWDGDSRRAADEPLLTAPLTVTLGSITQTVVGGGQFLFWDVPAGMQTITPDWAGVDPQTTAKTALAFPGVEGGVIRGALWLDANGDFQRQPWELPLANAPVLLNGVQVALSDANGRFILTGLAAGTYNVSTVLPGGFVAPVVTVTISDEQGAAVGLPATYSTTKMVYLPLLRR